MDDILLRADDGAICTLTLNDPGRLNALSTAMLTRLESEFTSIAGDPAIRVVILKGTGRAFCAGHDLREMTAARQSEDAGRAAFQALFALCTRVMLGIVRLPQPVIAEVHGIATAAGCQLVASCDLAVAAEGTRFGVNGVNIGLFCSTPMVALSRVVPRKRAFELLVTGEFADAGEARAMGLVNRVVPEAELSAAAQALAATIAGKLGPAVRIGKRAFYEQAELPLDAAYALAGEVMAENMLLGDTAEGITAFIEKRPPAWAQ
ncbi:enoyl-CoA hydratase/carnithine racemase [Amaricoccus macauensis]|uniref:Enoyl-CoA hydratase domain-containing protein 3, mitochondrial n=1 Tax=Amaricoccus macauensis TaxID=57001 RepID=A0A840STI5_9RHOB|nr:enoyl-CoA hydratase [Amaricoccus macauensis]MBB5223938.1 enoyl-CoA hydratase/carnithine racemase [Amaricoccus macauensis]